MQWTPAPMLDLAATPLAAAPATDPSPAPASAPRAAATAAPAAAAAPAAPATAAVAPTITPPRFDAAYLDNPAPAYPPAARRAGVQGRVVLRVRVSAAGEPVEVTVATSSGAPRLDHAAVATVRRWKFVPAREGERAVEAWVLVPIVFALR
jgi:protein TonB